MADLILTCEHASNAVPDELNGLGLDPAVLGLHIGYDIGAAFVARTLSEGLDAPLIEGEWSRLVIDLNRGEDDPTLIMRIADGAIVPGNAAHDGAERARRIRTYHAPFHQAVAAQIGKAADPVLLSIHSFTPEFQGRKRPFELAVQWARDPRLPKPLMAALSDAGFAVADNEPYLALPGDSMDRHGNRNGLPHALLEIRQDLIGTQADAQALAGRLMGPVRAAVAAL